MSQVKGNVFTIDSVGYCRLYDAIHCEIEGQTHYACQFDVGPFFAQIHIGPIPRYGIDLTSSDNYGIPGGTIEMPPKIYDDVSTSGYKRNFFVEIACWRKLTEDTPRRTSPLPTTQDKIDFTSMADVIAGVLGLKFHSQLVFKQICEGFILTKGQRGFPGDEGFERIKGGKFRIVEDVKLDSSSLMGGLNLDSQKVAKNTEGREFLALVWLLRAWKETDDIAKFLSLFTSIEVLLLGRKMKSAVEEEEDRQIKSLITKHGGKDKQDLLAYFNKMKKNGKRPPSLSEKFVHIAMEANLPEWEKDVEAFRKFNLIRNGLIHQGKQNVSFHIAVGEVSEQRLTELEDLVERYVNWHLFGESPIYKSHSNRIGIHPTRMKPPSE